MSSKKWQTPLTVLLACGITPFLVNGFYAHPWTDDYYYSALARSQGFADGLAYYYSHFNGRYFSISLLLTNPLVYGQLWGYKLIPILLGFSLWASILCLVSAITRDTVSLRGKLLFSLALLLVYFDQMPDIRPGLYWMSGSLTYQAGAVLLLLFNAMLLRIINPADEQRGRFFTGATAILLAACLPGSNEIILLLLFPALGLWFWFDWLRGGRSRCLLSTILATVAIGAGFALLAPGNAARLSSYEGNRNSILAMHNALEATFASTTTWATTPSVLLLALLVATATRRNTKLRAVMSGISPLTAISLLILGVIACYFPPLWSTGNYPERRVVNLIYLLFLTGWMINVSAIAARANLDKLSLQQHTKKYLIYPLIALFLTGLLFLGHSNLLLVMGDLASGASSRFDAELRHRYASIRQDSRPHHTVTPLENTPKSLFFSDIDYDQTEESWVNRCYADYYGKETITQEKPILQTVAD